MTFTLPNLKRVLYLSSSTHRYEFVDDDDEEDAPRRVANELCLSLFFDRLPSTVFDEITNGKCPSVTTNNAVSNFSLDSSVEVNSTGWFICFETWAGLTLIWVFHYLAQLHSHFCRIPISLSRTGQRVKQLKSKSTLTNPGLGADESHYKR